jgi:hypothetical protein
MTYRPTVLVDFDGVIHRYSKGWHDGTAYDEPIHGAKAALGMMTEAGYDVVIFSTRKQAQIIEWLYEYDFPQYLVTDTKMPAVAIIDDRAIRFTSWLDSLHQLYQNYPVKTEES